VNYKFAHGSGHGSMGKIFLSMAVFLFWKILFKNEKKERVLSAFLSFC
jgi:hypothetical protein